ncbi:hypothetical protein B0J18DRAFT_91976 [Chaetomium sp. MPI-SDFR-AT-0129]|nr:hypothetical protein B0J18DRAFT_91976 [Chaetomium sp. MPI-SDFR-AT-0129]
MSCAANYVLCPQPNIPSNFCCPTDTTCNLLAGGTTVLCCPSRSSCERIAPIVCNVSLMDAETDPESTVKTTALNSTLVACGGTTCCPFGYDCVNNGDPEANGGFGELCVVKKDQSVKPPVRSETATGSGSRPPPTTATSDTGVPGQSTTMTGSSVETTASSVETTASSPETTATETRLSDTAATPSPSWTSGRNTANPSNGADNPNNSSPSDDSSSTAATDNNTLRIVIPVVVCVVLACFLAGGIWAWKRRRTRQNKKRASQTRFEKVELDAEGCEIIGKGVRHELAGRRSVKHELEVIMDPVELPASPIPRAKARV